MNGATGSCTLCPAGQNSSTGASSCYMTDILGGQPFSIQSAFTNRLLIATSPLRQVCTPYAVPYIQFTYNATSLQIYSPTTNLCLDDLGIGYSPGSASSDILAFKPCTQSKTQQFRYFPSTGYILNPNNPYNKCLDSNDQYPDIFQFQCGSLNHVWHVLLSCMPGITMRF